MAGVGFFAENLMMVVGVRVRVNAEGRYAHICQMCVFGDIVVTLMMRVMMMRVMRVMRVMMMRVNVEGR